MWLAVQHIGLGSGSPLPGLRNCRGIRNVPCPSLNTRPRRHPPGLYQLVLSWASASVQSVSVELGLELSYTEI